VGGGSCYVNLRMLIDYGILLPCLVCSVIRRLITLISAHGALQADCDAAKRQAESATEAAKRFMENAESKQDKV
jgi:hypothetical protein